MDKYNQKWVLRFAQGGSKTNAITIGQTTYYSESKEFVDKDPAWRAHEEEHKRQWREEGRCKFSMFYIWYLVKHGYIDNPYEIKARGAERG